MVYRVVADTQLFFTGSAGTGKSFLLGHIIKQLRKVKDQYGNPKVIAVTASTGIAVRPLRSFVLVRFMLSRLTFIFLSPQGLNIKGQTLHSWSGVGLGLEDAHTLAEKVMGVFTTRDGYKMQKSGHSESSDVSTGFTNL